MTLGWQYGSQLLLTGVSPPISIWQLRPLDVGLEPNAVLAERLLAFQWVAMHIASQPLLWPMEREFSGGYEDGGLPLAAISRPADILGHFWASLASSS